MIKRRYTSNILGEKGYTLIELLTYVVMLGTLLTAITAFFGLAVDARVKNQTITEVNDQGTAIMDYITQTIRNASSVTTPAAGASSGSLTLVVPTGSLSPTVFDASNTTVLGTNSDGGTTDGNDSNSINATQFTANATGTITTLYALVGATVGASPNNQGQMAIYSGASSPTTLLANSGSVVLTPGAWNAFSISTVNVTSGQKYWLAYNTNGSSGTQNNLRYGTGTTNQTMYKTSSTYGTWPASWSGTQDSSQNSMYASISSGGNSVPEVKEGVGGVVSLANSRMQVSGLTFTNLTRTGTAGIVRVSFTLSRLNPNSRNEYDYQKTFTSSAEIGW